MKKFMSVAIVFVLLFTMCACSSDAEKVKQYVEENKEDLLAGFSDGLQGLNAEADLYAEGTGIVIEAKLALLDGATDEVINVLKVTFESEETKTAMKESIKEAQKELPELDSMTLKLCDSKGTVLVTQKYN